MDIVVGSAVYHAMLNKRCKAVFREHLEGLSLFDAFRVFEKGVDAPSTHSEWFIARIVWIQRIELGSRVGYVISFDVVTNTLPSLPSILEEAPDSEPPTKK
jgi:hypothetical protein